MTSLVESCQQRIGYRFQDTDLLAQALTHPSMASSEFPHNERLEFLGDAVLGLITCRHLFDRFPDYREGDLTRVKSVIVSRVTLARVAKGLELEQFLQVGRGLLGGKRLPRRILGNLFEAVLGAVYLDGGIEAASEFALRALTEEIEHVVSDGYDGDSKSLLQQLVQRDFGTTPTYAVVAEEGPDHQKRFRVVVMIGSTPYEAGDGRTKKQAEQEAAARTFVQLSESEEPTGPAS